MALSVNTLKRLKSQLLTSGLSQKNNDLFQIIDQLIDYITQLNQALFGTTGTSGVIPAVPVGISNDTFITRNNETSTLPNSLQLIAGDNVTLDYSMANQVTVSADITQTIVNTTNQPLVVKSADIEIPPNRKTGKLIVRDKFTDSQIGGPVFISQVPNNESDMVFILFIGKIIDTHKMQVFWQAPFGAPRKMQINYLIGA